MFKNFWTPQEQQTQPRPQMVTESWYSSSSASSPSPSHPTTPSGSTSSSFRRSIHPDQANTFSNVSPAEAAGIIAILKDKSVDELRKLLSDRDACRNLVHSLEHVKMQNKVRDDLRHQTLQLARDNLEKEPRIMELRNQCRIIRTTELATAQEKLLDFERNKDEILKYCSPSSLLHRLEDGMSKTDEESEALHAQLLNREIDLPTFVQKYKKMRHAYHKQYLTHVAAKTSVPT